MSFSSMRAEAVNLSAESRRSPASRSVCLHSTFIRLGQAAVRWPSLTKAAFFASVRSRPAPTRALFVLGGENKQPSPTRNLLLGRLDGERFIDGIIELNAERTREAFSELKSTISSVDEFAAGILRIVESNMERAVRYVSVERGHDPREFVLLAFGGGGPVHACALARALQIPKVLIPALPGALSALGILLADVTRERITHGNAARSDVTESGGALRIARS